MTGHGRIKVVGTMMAAATTLLSMPVKAEFGCYEWPSHADSNQNVQYLVSHDCDMDLDALGQNRGFDHIRSRNTSEVGCSNSAGMVYLGDLCNETLSALNIIFPNSTVINSTECDNGFITTPTNTSCSGLRDILTKLISAPKQSSTTSPAVDMAPPVDSITGFLEGHSTNWLVTVGAICSVGVVAVVAAAAMAVKKMHKSRMQKSAGEFHHPSIGKHVKVKQGVYSGIDELGFTADEIKVMDPVESSRRGRNNSTAVEPASPAANVRYHHPDWCASTPSAADVDTPKKTLKVANRRRLSQSTLLPKPVPGWDQDESLLLY